MVNELETDVSIANKSTVSGKLNQDKVDDSTDLVLEPGEIRDDGTSPSISPTSKPISRFATQFNAFPVDAV